MLFDWPLHILNQVLIIIERCPERNNPGRYDICGHSHQIWHCLVVLGIVFTYFGCM
ncbi:MAG: hemolysin III family protein [Bdellovibrionales bacterium]|nr:hemolysin III family protein [Bdellovibrionales bacterium]